MNLMFFKVFEKTETASHCLDDEGNREKKEREKEERSLMIIFRFGA